MSNATHWRFVTAALAALALAGCGGGGPLEGTWTRTMSGEGDLTMTVSGGKASFALPDGRWPDPVDLTAAVKLDGETLSVTDEAGPAACGKPAPTYTAKVEGTSLTIGGGGTDPCGARHAVLVGTWTKK